MTTSVRGVLVTFAFILFASAAQAQNPAIGSWDFTTLSPEGEFKSILVIREEDGKLKAFAKSEQGERPYDSIAVDGTKVTMVLTIPYNGSPMVIYLQRQARSGEDGRRG